MSNRSQNAKFIFLLLFFIAFSKLIIAQVPPNDLCENAQAVFVNNTFEGNTTFATINPDLQSCGTSLNSAPGVWYSVFNEIACSMTTSLCGSGYDTKIGIFKGSCDSLICIGGNDDSCGLQSEITFNTDYSTQYYIYVSGYSNNAGEFTLSLTAPICDPIGCTDIAACNYDSNSVFDDGSCEYSGWYIPQSDTSSFGMTTSCDTVSGYFYANQPCANFIAENSPNCLEIWDSSCSVEYDICLGSLGCTDSLACNYDVFATVDDGTCLMAFGCDICDGDGGVIDNPEIGTSCDDGDEMTVNDVIGEGCECVGTLIIFGCTNPEACNYDSSATQDDGTCLMALGCDICDGDGGVIDNPEIGTSCDDGDEMTVNDVIGEDCECAGTLIVFGCTIPEACNYEIEATQDDGTCEYDSCAGCTDSEAINYNEEATIDDGSCEYDCILPTFIYDTFCNEENSNNFYISLNITNIGNGMPYLLINNQNNDEVLISSIGKMELGPFENNTDVILSFVSNNDENCVATSSSISADCIVSVEEHEVFDFKTYPNPNSGKFVVFLQNYSGNATITCYDLLGRNIYTDNSIVFSSDELIIDLGERISKGVYFIKIKTEIGILTKRLIVEEVRTDG